jgi:hypothetical protein
MNKELGGRQLDLKTGAPFLSSVVSTDNKSAGKSGSI